MGPTWMGKYFVSPEEYDTFLALHTAHGRPTALLERHLPSGGPILIDLDFRYTAALVARAFTMADVRHFVAGYESALRELTGYKGTLRAFVMLKPTPGDMKDGIHIIWPDVTVPYDVQFAVRDTVLGRGLVSACFGDACGLPTEILDKSVIKSNNWFLYGATKPDAVAAYRVVDCIGGGGTDGTWTENDAELTRLFSLQVGRDTLTPGLDMLVRPPIAKSVSTVAKKKTATAVTASCADSVITHVYESEVANDNRMEPLLLKIPTTRWDNYSDWLTIGMALFNEGCSVELWDKMSQTADTTGKYTAGACATKWASFRRDADRKVTARTLMSWVSAGDDRSIYITGTVTMEEFNTKRTEFEETHFYLKENGSVCQIREDGSLLMMTHSHATSNYAPLCFEKRDENRLRRTPFFPLWMTTMGRREYDRLVFRPDGICAENEYNTVRPLRGSLMPVAADSAGLDRFLEIALVLANGNMEHRDYILKWTALKLQKPWVVPGVCLVFTGPQGVGKNMFWEFVGRCLIGKGQFVYTDNVMRDVFDTYSETQMSNLFCLMDEMSAGVTRKMANELKAKITATMARINPKGLRPFNIDTYMSWVLLTNDASPVKLESGDRRYCIFNTGRGHKGDYAYWTETSTLFARDDVAGSVYKYLVELDLTNFVVGKFPVTELREMMMEAERPVEESFLVETATKVEGNEWRGTNQEFYRLYADWCKDYEIKPLSAVGFGRAMTPYILKGWLSDGRNSAVRTKSINLYKIRAETK